MLMFALAMTFLRINAETGACCFLLRDADPRPSRLICNDVAPRIPIFQPRCFKKYDNLNNIRSGESSAGIRVVKSLRPGGLRSRRSSIGASDECAEGFHSDVERILALNSPLMQLLQCPPPCCYISFFGAKT